MGNAASTTRYPPPPTVHIAMPGTLQVSEGASGGGGGGGSATPASATAAHPHSHPHAAKKHHYQRPPCACQHLHPGKTCLSYLVSSFGRAFYLSYGIKAGISLALHMIKLLRSKRPSAVFEIDQLVGAHGLPVDAVRMGLFLGSFTGLYNGMRCLLARWTGRDDAVTVMTAGAVAGLSIHFHPADSHRTLALYIFARVFQCAYNRAKMEGKWHLWGSDWAHGDSLLFAIGTAQVMYSYVMRPDTLPPAYFKFIVETGPIPLRVLEQVKASNRGLPVDLDVLTNVATKLAPRGSRPIADVLQDLAVRAYGPGAPANMPPILPCSILHPHNAHCHHQWTETFLNAAKRSLPLYTSLTIVPMLVLRFWAFIRHPVDSLLRGGWSIARSTTFLSSFVSIYMFLICMQRRAFLRDHRSVYWLAGFVSAWTILLEQKSRRSELALYVLPRAIDSLLITMQDRKLLSTVPHGEKALFCAGMSLLMYYREYHAETMSPLLRRLLNFFVPTFKSMPKEGAAAAAATAGAASASSSTGGAQSSCAQSPVGGSSSLLTRADSDGLPSGVMPLPTPGISLSREQSASQIAFLPSLPPFVTNSRAAAAATPCDSNGINGDGSSCASSCTGGSVGAVSNGSSSLPSSGSFHLFARDISPTASPLCSSNGFSPEVISPSDMVQVLVQPMLLPSAVGAQTQVTAPGKNGAGAAAASVTALPCVVEPPDVDDTDATVRDDGAAATDAVPVSSDPSAPAAGHAEKAPESTPLESVSAHNQTKHKKKKGRK